MSAGEVRVHLVLDLSKFEAAIRATRRFTASMRSLRTHFALVTRAAYRQSLTPGERHIDRVCKEILAGKPGRDAATRLLVATDLAAVIDRQAVA